jgi:hypothetical protein
VILVNNCRCHSEKGQEHTTTLEAQRTTLSRAANEPHQKLRNVLRLERALCSANGRADAEIFAARHPPTEIRKARDGPCLICQP